MDLWGKVFAAGYDWFMAGCERGGLAAERQTLVAGAAGRVLEIGGGTGANLPFYCDAVSELVIAEPEAPMATRLEKKLEGYRIPTRVVREPAEHLPVETASVDCVISTLVLCTVSDPARALAEARRVLKPGARLMFIEHVRAEDPSLARWQDRLRRPWSWFGHGCQCNRATVDAVREAGFSISELRQTELPNVPPIVKPVVVGVATRP